MSGLSRSVVLAAVLAALAAPSAQADPEHLFVATDGTICRLTQSHATTPEPGGTYTIAYETAISCDKPVTSVVLYSHLERPPDASWYPWGDPRPFFACGQRWNPCEANKRYAWGGSESGLEAAVYNNFGAVSMQAVSPAVWAVTPKAAHQGEATSCLPDAWVTCSVREVFKPE